MQAPIQRSGTNPVPQRFTWQCKILAVAARAFFTKTLDAFGVQADAQLGEMFDPDVRQQVTVGRPFADA